MADGCFTAFFDECDGIHARNNNNNTIIEDLAMEIHNIDKVIE